MNKFHINPDTGETGKCSAKIKCRFTDSNGNEPQHYSSKKEAKKVSEQMLDKKYSLKTLSKTIIKNGVPVIENKIVASNFVKTFNQKIGSNSYYDGSFEDLTKLVEENWSNQEPGAGSVDNDVVLVTVPPKNFYTSITGINKFNKKYIVEEEYVRQEGEKPVKHRTLPGFDKTPAKFVKIVVYRADTLAQDNDRSSDAEWEIIAVNAEIDENTPMTPETMKRNSNHDQGGTYREYSDKEWKDAYKYWDNHVMVDNSKPKIF